MKNPMQNDLKANNNLSCFAAFHSKQHYNDSLNKVTDLINCGAYIGQIIYIIDEDAYYVVSSDFKLIPMTYNLNNITIGSKFVLDKNESICSNYLPDCIFMKTNKLKDNVITCVCIFSYNIEDIGKIHWFDKTVRVHLVDKELYEE